MIDPADSVTRSISHPIRLNLSSQNRTYSLALDKDLFDQWTLTRSWGGKNDNFRGRKVSQVTSYETGMEMLKRIVKIREKQGYKVSRNI
jgi:hypothetical protein